MISVCHKYTCDQRVCIRHFPIYGGRGESYYTEFSALDDRQRLVQYASWPRLGWYDRNRTGWVGIWDVFDETTPAALFRYKRDDYQIWVITADGSALLDAAQDLYLVKKGHVTRICESDRCFVPVNYCQDTITGEIVHTIPVGYGINVESKLYKDGGFIGNLDAVCYNAHMMSAGNTLAFAPHLADDGSDIMLYDVRTGLSKPTYECGQVRRRRPHEICSTSRSVGDYIFITECSTMKDHIIQSFLNIYDLRMLGSGFYQVHHEYEMPNRQWKNWSSVIVLPDG